MAAIAPLDARGRPADGIGHACKSCLRDSPDALHDLLDLGRSIDKGLDQGCGNGRGTFDVTGNLGGLGDCRPDRLGTGNDSLGRPRPGLQHKIGKTRQNRGRPTDDSIPDRLDRGRNRGGRLGDRRPGLRGRREQSVTRDGNRLGDAGPDAGDNRDQRRPGV